MKLLYMTPGIFNSGGTERVLSMKVNYLVDKCGYDIVIVTTDQKGRSCFFDFDNRIKYYDLCINYCDDSTLSLFDLIKVRYQKDKLYKDKLLKIIQKEKPDVCISMFNKEYDFLGDLKLSCKIVAELHFNLRFRENSYLSVHKGLLWRAIAKYRTRQMIRTSQKYDRVVVLTKEDLRTWEKTNCNVEQIYNPLPYENDVCSSLEYKSFVSVGRLAPPKNYESLVAAWSIVQKKHPDWKMNIWGDGDLQDFLEEKIRLYHVEKTFILNGRTNQVDKEYLKNSAFVMSSRYEGFPMVLLEASSFGLPLISYACYCGPRDIIEDGMNGFLVEFGDEKALAERLCTVIEDEELRKKMGKYSKEVSHQFSQNRILPLWPAFFEKLVSQ